MNNYIILFIILANRKVLIDREREREREREEI